MRWMALGVAGVAATAYAGETLRFDGDSARIEAAMQEAGQQAPAPDQPPAPAPADGFGLANGTWWGGFIGGYAREVNGNSSANDFNAAFTLSNFLADDFELNLEFGGWYFDQPGDDTFGLNFNLIFRWHFLHPEDSRDWTIFADGGAGILVSEDLVPDGGTGFNFTPRAGAGGTLRLGQSANRLIVGVRWHHISNARINGEERNPGRDGVMVYAGVLFPF